MVGVVLYEARADDRLYSRVVLSRKLAYGIARILS